MPAKNSKNTGTEYELFVQEVLNRLHAVEGTKQVKIEHDVVLTGISGATHQLDLYWQFNLAGIRYRVAVECKGYASRVSKEKIAAFKGVLDDLGGISGIYACRNGYQKGAKQYAESYGIQLMEIRHPNDEDWKGRMRDIHLLLVCRVKSNLRLSFIADKQWVENNCPNMKDGYHGSATETFIEQEGLVKSVEEILKELPTNKVEKDITKCFIYDNAYVVQKTNSKENAPARIKVKELDIVYDVIETKEEICFYGDDIVQAIVKDTQNGTSRMVGIDGTVWDCK